jgi:regulator of protease activity HflC (stomatin/prohibitin superfamily)
METAGYVFWTILAIVAIFMLSGLRMVQQYEKSDIFVLGKLQGAKGPGLFWVCPIITSTVKIDMRVITLEIKGQKTLTKNKVEVTVGAVIFYKVKDPAKAVTEVQDYRNAVDQLGSITIRKVCGIHDLSDLLSKRDTVNGEVKEDIEKLTATWGVEIITAELKDIDIPKEMLRAMGQAAEAAQAAEARKINADGEKAAAEILGEAAEIMGRNPATLELRRLQTLERIATENAVIVVPNGTGANIAINPLTKPIEKAA